MGMRPLLGLAAFAVSVCFAMPASADKAVMSVTPKGHDLEIVVRGATDYCSTNAGIEVIRKADTIRIIRSRPSRVSRCLTHRDITFVVHDVPAGTYAVSYEQIPLVAPARALKLASATAVVAP